MTSSSILRQCRRQCFSWPRSPPSLSCICADCTLAYSKSTHPHPPCPATLDPAAIPVKHRRSTPDRSSNNTLHRCHPPCQKLLGSRPIHDCKSIFCKLAGSTSHRCLQAVTLLGHLSSTRGMHCNHEARKTSCSKHHPFGQACPKQACSAPTSCCRCDCCKPVHSRVRGYPQRRFSLRANLPSQQRHRMCKQHR